MDRSTPTLEQRFDDLLSRNRRRIGAIAHSYGGRQSDDLLQEILLQIWRSLPGLRQQIHVDTWCYRVALNTAFSWLRRVRREAITAIEPAVAEQIVGSDDGHETGALLRRFLPTLNETDRAMVLMYLEDISTTEMAEILGTTEGAIRVRIHRIKQKLTEWEADLS
jgi:RNA polymerase sigma-70 factor (ECF subfamily)